MYILPKFFTLIHEHILSQSQIGMLPRNQLYACCLYVAKAKYEAFPTKYMVSQITSLLRYKAILITSFQLLFFVYSLLCYLKHI